MNQKQFDDDDVASPIWVGYEQQTLQECMAKCENEVDSRGRPCVAIEWSDEGQVPDSIDDTKKPCALAWGCDYLEPRTGGSVYKRDQNSSVCTLISGRPSDHVT